MLTGEIRSQIDAVWNAFWSGGISNPLEVIEQITYLLFIRRHDLQKLTNLNVAFRRSLTTFDASFDSLQHRAFRGEL
jgi:type I restriction enzyme M protein